MDSKYLTLGQNICAARIFLNTFGLILEDVIEVNEFSKIKILDQNRNAVGELHFCDGKVILSANYNDSVLEASYDIAEITGFVGIENNKSAPALFGQWVSKIIFSVKKENLVNLSGEFLLDCSADSEFGVTCWCHTLINCEVSDKGKVILKNQNDGRTFGLEISFGDYNEAIDIMPWDEMNGFIKHVITKGEYDKETYSYPYKRYAGIFSAGRIEERKEQLHVFLSERELKKELSLYNDWPTKVGADNSKELLIQKGILMKQLDSDMYSRIKELRELLFIGDVSLLDNLINVCYDSYSDEEIYALLGLQRQKMNYQDGADNLRNSYFGIGRNSYFLPLEEQKKLLKDYQ